MRSLTVKLTLAFLLVGLVGSVSVAAILRYRTRTAFDQFILNREQQLLINSLLLYYQRQGGWEGLAESLQADVDWLPNLFAPAFEARRELPRFTLVGLDRRVVFSALPNQVGALIPEGRLRESLALEVDGETIGWLIITPAPREWLKTSPEYLFLRNLNQATLLSALFALGLALVVGGVLAFTLTRSLRELTEATQQIAQGKLGLQVKVRSKDELGELAESFNKMSRDLERATQARRQMTADIAHDLRSPLSVIGGYAEALSDGKLPGSSEIYDVLYQETRHLSRLVEDLRLLSLADAGELSLTRQPVAARLILERAAARHAIAAQQRGISLRIEAPQDLPEVNIDMERMAQVMDNLLINAFRYTPAGGEVALMGKAEGAQVRLAVQDNGSGISPQDLPHVFDRLYRGDKARAQNGESGLGLAIARSIVEVHGGTISVASEPGKGSTFTILLQAGDSKASPNQS